MATDPNLRKSLAINDPTGRTSEVKFDQDQFVEGHSQVRNEITHNEYLGDDVVRFTSGLFGNDLTCGIFFGLNGGVIGV